MSVVEKKKNKSGELRTDDLPLQVGDEISKLCDRIFVVGVWLLAGSVKHLRSGFCRTARESESGCDLLLS